MKQNTNFLLNEIAGIPYLLPFGQMIADHRRGLKTNATGAYLWNLLEQERSLEELIFLSSKYYEISPDDLPAFREEITHFLQQLLSYGIVLDSPPSFPLAGQEEQTISIAGLNIKLLGPKEAFPPAFADFILTPCPDIHQTIFIHTGTPQIRTNGRVILRSTELIVMEQETSYLLLFPMSKHISEIQLSKDGAAAHCYCLPPYTESFHSDLFHAIRLLYLYLAQQCPMAALHSASLLYRDRLWLFSGHSGMGKSTHTNLWKELYETPIINGDLNLLALKQNHPVVHGIPWCGTSRIYDTKTYPLGGIILLNKARENLLEPLSPDQKRLLIAQRLISPTWKEEHWNKNMNLVNQIADSIFVCRLHCTKEYSAAEFMKQHIDSYLNGTMHTEHGQPC